MYLDLMGSKERAKTARLHVYLFASALFGLLTALYLLTEEGSGGGDGAHARVCDVNAVVSCSRVLESEFAVLFGVPVAALGVAWYTMLVW